MVFKLLYGSAYIFCLVIIMYSFWNSCVSGICVNWSICYLKYIGHMAERITAITTIMLWDHIRHSFLEILNLSNIGMSLD